ncbi:MAG TPA: hypothetical protein VNP04_07200 [Alphaproteobacteria bacterium]|nr:hypothetical protein [Alphaproteobacteria bacterium]
MSRRLRVIAGGSLGGRGQEEQRHAETRRRIRQLLIEQVLIEALPQAHECIRWTEISDAELWAIVDHAAAECRRRGLTRGEDGRHAEHDP